MSRSASLNEDRILAELKQINKKLDKKKSGQCRTCHARNKKIKQLLVEKASLLGYIKELENFSKLPTS